MAKSNKNTIPTINPPNGGMRAWLNQNDPATSGSAADGTSTREETTTVKVEDSQPGVPTETQVVEKPEIVNSATVEETSQPSKSDEGIKGKDVSTSPESVATSAVASIPRKSKNKGGEDAKSSSYLETFFKKPVKENGTSLASDGKPVRITEESHYLLSVLVSEARRQGYKLNVGDLIDNLLTHHRSEHKSEVDELIAKWKARKRFE